VDDEEQELSRTKPPLKGSFLFSLKAPVSRSFAVPSLSKHH
jgi:hypothetical protein